MIFRCFLPMLIVLGCSACHQKPGSLLIRESEVMMKKIAEDDFESDLSYWVVEQRPGGTVAIKDGKMDIDDSTGCTVWFRQKLEGNVMIEYEAVVVDNGGPNDRVSDLNCFWMARDPDHPDDFFAASMERNGKFQNYHHLQLYFVGLGGHNNTKTRFRRYAGGGVRPCLPEHDLDNKEYLITPNTLNRIRLIVKDKYIQYYRNYQLIYDFVDQDPYREGYFGIRTYKNHMTMDHFKVYKLIE